MRNFTGDVGKKPQVSLGGRTRKEESREQVLERTRLERERRLQAKKEQQAATTIQAYWRRWRSLQQVQLDARAAWTAQYGEQGQLFQAAESSLALGQPLLPMLLVFSSTGSSSSRVDPATLHADVLRLVAVCRLLLAAAKQPGGLMVLMPAAEPQSAAGPPAVTRVVYLLARLAAHCLAALNCLLQLDAAARQQLAAPRASAAELAQPAALPAVSALGETLLLLVAADSWGWVAAAAGSPWTAAGAASAVVTRLVLGFDSRRQLAPTTPYVSRNSILSRTLGRAMLQSSQCGIAAGSTGRSYAEVLTTQLVVRALSAKLPGSQSLLLENLPPEQGLHLLLCVPDLLTLAPSLAPVAKHLVRLAAASIACLSPSHIIRHADRCLLSQADGQPCGPAASAVALVGNLVTAGSKVLSTPGASTCGTALHLCTALNHLLTVIPDHLQPPTNSSTMDDEDEQQFLQLQRTLDAAAEGAPDAAGHAQAAEAQQGHSRGKTGGNSRQLRQLEVPPDEMFPAELQTSMQGLFGASGVQLLRSLVPTLLPLASPADPVSASDPLQYLPGAWQLCRLAATVAAHTPNKLHLHVSLSLTMGFVPRVWFSVLRPLRLHQLAASTSSGASPVPASAWLAPSTATATATASSSRSSNGVMGGGPSPELDVLGLFCSVYLAHLAVAEVGEFYAGVPLPLTELYDSSRTSQGLLAYLKATLWGLLWTTDFQQQQQSQQPRAVFTSGAAPSSYSPAKMPAAAARSSAAADSQRPGLSQQAAALQRRVFLRSAGELYQALYDRNGSGTAQGSGVGGRHFCPASVFYASNLGPDRFAAEAAAARESQEEPANGHLSSRTDVGYKIWQVLKHAPALVPFEERARLFQTEVQAARQEHIESAMRSRQMFAEMTGMFQPNQFVKVRRKQMLLDGFDACNSQPPEWLKGQVRVAFLDDEGQAEAGVDGGGLFKDFLEGLLKEGFGGERGLFLANAQNELYPNPAAYGVLPEAPQLFRFLGRMLGKALWEGILLELPLAQFFLKKLRGGRCELRDLPSLDLQLYNNLVSLKTYQGSLSDLSLTFTADHEVYGAHTEVELKPGGSQVPVTTENVAEYVARMADYRLNVEPARACAAFINGFHEMVPPEWVSLFNESELQMLISGRSGVGGLDLNDLRQNTDYAGGYHNEHPVVAHLWEALESFDPHQQHQFLKFVTACSRAPLLGFRYLKPGLCVQMAGSVLDPECTKRLPTAATCINLLKLPPYQSTEQMREKLLTAITGATTFELS